MTSRQHKCSKIYPLNILCYFSACFRYLSYIVKPDIMLRYQTDVVMTGFTELVVISLILVLFQLFVASFVLYGGH